MAALSPWSESLGAGNICRPLEAIRAGFGVTLKAISVTTIQRGRVQRLRRTEKRLREMADKPSSAEPAMPEGYVKLVSEDGSAFIIELRYARLSKFLCAMLDGKQQR